MTFHLIFKSLKRNFHLTNISHLLSCCSFRSSSLNYRSFQLESLPSNRLSPAAALCRRYNRLRSHQSRPSCSLQLIQGNEKVVFQVKQVESQVLVGASANLSFQFLSLFFAFVNILAKCLCLSISLFRHLEKIFWISFCRISS